MLTRVSLNQESAHIFPSLSLYREVGVANHETDHRHSSSYSMRHEVRRINSHHELGKGILDPGVCLMREDIRCKIDDLSASKTPRKTYAQQ